MPKKTMGSAKKSFGLGAGLDALLPETEGADLSIRELDIGDIDPNPDQPRQIFSEESLNQLAQSIREQGVLQPLIVTPGKNGRFHLVAGERRWRASRIAGKTTVPCVVRDLTLNQQMEIALIENLQREDLNPLETAEGIRSLMDTTHFTQEQVAQRLSMSRPAVANTLRLLTLPDEVMDLIRSGVLSSGHGRVLAGLSTREEQIELANEAVSRGYSVRQMEMEAARRKNGGHRVPTKPAAISLEMKQLQNGIRQAFGMQVSMQGTENKGKIVLQYSTRDELEHLYELIEQLGGEMNA